MDRRIVSGLVSLAIVAGGRAGPARAGDLDRVPPTAGLGGLPPLPGEVPTPRPTIPASPLSSPPVGMPTLPTLRDSINGGLAPGYVPASRLTAPRPEQATRRASPLPWKDDPAAVRSTLVDGAELLPPSVATSPGPAIPAGRSAPFANRVPAAPRVQVAPAPTSAGGRPAPHAAEVPAGPRPQAPTTRLPAAEPAPEAPPALDPVSPRAESPPDLASPVVASPTTIPAPSLDPGVVPATREDATALRATADARTAPVASQRAASVGGEVITMHELQLAVNETVRRHGDGQKPDRATLNQIAARVLDGLIEESLIVQEAKRKMGNNAKTQTMFDDYAERKFREDELAPMLRKTGLSNEYELNKKLVAETGRSLNDRREAFKKQITARDFLWNQIHSKVSADIFEMREFYNENLARFDCPAQVTWREVEVDARKTPDRATARKKAEAALDRLRRGEDFEQVARTASDGATAKKGGLWQTSPGGFGDPAINAALDQLPIGQVSQIIEGPTSFRIVRVEARREAGPARFDEVQEQIRKVVFEKNFDKAREDYLLKLRRRNLVDVPISFGQAGNDPSSPRRDDPAVRTTSGR